MSRNLELESTENTAGVEFEPIRVVRTFGADNSIKTCTKAFENLVTDTKAFTKIREKLTKGSYKFFQYVNKVAPSLHNRLVKLKTIAMGTGNGKTEKCGHRNCECCSVINSDESPKYIDNIIVREAKGTCDSFNIIYMICCDICSKAYIGRTTRPLKVRIGEHRRKYYDILEKVNDTMDIDDSNAIGLHLVQFHNVKHKTDFNKLVTVHILENVSPMNMEIKEHKYIHKYKTLSPKGLNINNPFKIPLLKKL